MNIRRCVFVSILVSTSFCSLSTCLDSIANSYLIASSSLSPNGILVYQLLMWFTCLFLILCSSVKLKQQQQKQQQFWNAFQRALCFLGPSSITATTKSLSVLKNKNKNRSGKCYLAYLYIGPISMAFQDLNNAWSPSLPILINYSFTNIYWAYLLCVKDYIRYEPYNREQWALYLESVSTTFLIWSMLLEKKALYSLKKIYL